MANVPTNFNKFLNARNTYLSTTTGNIDNNREDEYFNSKIGANVYKKLT